MTDNRQYDGGMSTPAYIDQEPSLDAITQRIRSYMGDKKISRSKLALATGIGRTTLGGKLDGQSSFTLDELLSIAHALDKHWLWVMSGDEPPRPTRAPSAGRRGEAESGHDEDERVSSQPVG